MKVSVIDSNYSDQKFEGLAASWLKWEISKNGGEIVAPDSCDALLITGSSPEGTPKLKTAIKKYHRNGVPIFVGGGISASPATIDNYVTGVCVGEGRNFIRTLLTEGVDRCLSLPETWIRGESRAVIPSVEFPWDVPPIKHPDGTIRVFAARGCRGEMFVLPDWMGTATQP